MDRFALRLSLGYGSAEGEVSIISAQQTTHPLDGIAPVVTPDQVRAMRGKVKAVRLSDELKRYVVDIVRATRTAPGVQLGAGPRASLALSRIAQGMALVEGGEFVTPDHIRELAVPVLAHRLALDPQAKFSGVTAAGIVTDILQRIAAPA